MTTYGTPDFFRPGFPAGVNIMGSNNYPSPNMTIYPTDVTSWAGVGVYLRPGGTIQPYRVDLNFYDDPAATHFVGGYSWYSYNNQWINDVVTPPAGFMAGQVTPITVGAPYSYDFWLRGYAGTLPVQHSMLDGILSTNNPTIEAFGQRTYWLSQTRAGMVNVEFDTDAPSFNVELGGFTNTGGPQHYALRASQAGYGTHFVQQVMLGRFAYRIVITNADAAAHAFNISVLST